jgi:hypothetical protein
LAGLIVVAVFALPRTISPLPAIKRLPALNTFTHAGYYRL